MLDFVSFRSLLEFHLQCDLRDHGADAHLQDDLAFDSLSMAEISVLFSNEGIELPDELLTELRTLADLQHYFNVLGAAAIAVGDDANPAIGRPS